jgi:hypothetical protein
MTYQIDGNSMLFLINRADIIDISVNDILDVKGLPGAKHSWTEQDAEFVENNPDDDIFLEIERVSENQYKDKGIVLRQPHGF